MGSIWRGFEANLIGKLQFQMVVLSEGGAHSTHTWTDVTSEPHGWFRQSIWFVRLFISYRQCREIGLGSKASEASLHTLFAKLLLGAR